MNDYYLCLYIKTMKEILLNIPKRTQKPRNKGLTMMMDKGLSINQAQDFLEVNKEYTDIIKLGFGTSIITPNISEKIKLYQKNGIIVYAGGTLFEAFAIRNQIQDYKKYLRKIGIKMVEISDGTININHQKKCDIISEFTKEFTVVSEVGNKSIENKISVSEWIKQIKEELIAGSWKVIAEARESGNIGIFENNGNIKSDLISEIIKSVNDSDIIWEAPKKQQQAWFINKLGSNVNLGNISADEVTGLECLRIGLRGDTFNIQ